MGWIRKKLRQLDRRVRKIFGKNAWLKVAALIGGVYMGMTGAGSGSVGAGKVFPIKSISTGKFGQFFTNLTAGLKNVFTFGGKLGSGPSGSKTTGTGPLGGKFGPSIKSWAGKTAGSTATDLAKGYIKEKIDPTFQTGTPVAIGSDEPSSIYDIAQTAYNNQYGSIDLMDAYKNIDYGPASTTTIDNLLPLFMGGDLRGRGISVYRDTSIPISQLT